METIVTFAIALLLVIIATVVSALLKGTNRRRTRGDEPMLHNTKGLRKRFLWPVPGTAKWFESQMDDKPQGDSGLDKH